MRRIVSVLAVMAVVAAMVAAMAIPAFAQGQSETAPNCARGNNTAYDSNGADNRNDQATRSLDKVYFDFCRDYY